MTKNDQEVSEFNDAEDLKRLSQFYYLVGAISCSVFCVPLLYFATGIIEVKQADETMDHLFGWFNILVGSFLFFFGRQIAQQKKYILSLIMAHIICLFIPFGTILGIFSIVILKRDSVKKLYGREL